MFQTQQGHDEIDSLDMFAVEPQLEQREMVVRYINGKGEARCHGGSDLKSSQSYPRQFLSWSYATRVLLVYLNLVYVIV